MPTNIEERLKKIPVICLLVGFCQKIKLPGFKGLSLYNLLELYGLGLVKGTLTTRASAIAFSFFTAIFPFLLFIIILIPNTPIEQDDFLRFLETFLPPQTSDFFMSSIFENLEGNQHAGLLSSVFLLSMFLMANGVNAVFSGFENSYHQQLTRNAFHQYLYALGVAIILVFLVLLTVAVFGYFQIYILTPIYEKWSGELVAESNSSVVWINFAKYMFFVLMIYVSTATLYYFGTREGRQTRFFSVGALLTTLLIITTSYLFGIYIDNFSKYNELYGSIGALLILLLYLWINSNILLLGHELNATLRGLKKLNFNDN